MNSWSDCGEAPYSFAGGNRPQAKLNTATHFAAFRYIRPTLSCPANGRQQTLHQTPDQESPWQRDAIFEIPPIPEQCCEFGQEPVHVKGPQPTALELHQHVVAAAVSPAVSLPLAEPHLRRLSIHPAIHPLRLHRSRQFQRLCRQVEGPGEVSSAQLSPILASTRSPSPLPYLSRSPNVDPFLETVCQLHFWGPQFRPPSPTAFRFRLWSLEEAFG